MTHLDPEAVKPLPPPDAGTPCVNCGVPFDVIRHRWLCPECKTKNSCCEGEPL